MIVFSSGACESIQNNMEHQANSFSDGRDLAEFVLNGRQYQRAIPFAKLVRENSEHLSIRPERKISNGVDERRFHSALTCLQTTLFRHLNNRIQSSALCIRHCSAERRYMVVSSTL